MEARPTIDCYASSIMVSDGKTTAREAEHLVDHGYRAIKIKVGQEPELAVDEILAKARRTITASNH